MAGMHLLSRCIRHITGFFQDMLDLDATPHPYLYRGHEFWIAQQI